MVHFHYKENAEALYYLPTRKEPQTKWIARVEIFTPQIIFTWVHAADLLSKIKQVGRPFN